MAMGLILLNSVAYGNTKAKITFIKGKAYQGPTQNGPWEILSIKESVEPGRFIKTEKKSIAEITLPDNSAIRIAPETLLELTQTLYSAKKKPKFSASLFLGKVWAKVSKSFGRNRGSFTVKTPTAIIGVRGTVYNLKTAADKSTDILVYEGVVGVGPPIITKDGPKKEISWPTEVTEKQWEEIILRRLQKLHISADGRPGKPEKFTPDDEKDAWVEWNQKRDMESQ
jgi:hypothetical protein